MTPLLAALLTVLVVVVLGAAVIAAVLSLGAAFGAAFAWGYTPVAAAMYARRQRASLAALELPPSRTYRPYRETAQDPAGVESDAYWQAARKAAAEAEEPLPATKPLPRIDPAAVLLPPVPYAVRYAFDPAGARTVVPERVGRAA